MVEAWQPCCSCMSKAADADVQGFITISRHARTADGPLVGLRRQEFTHAANAPGVHVYVIDILTLIPRVRWNQRDNRHDRKPLCVDCGLGSWLDVYCKRHQCDWLWNSQRQFDAKYDSGRADRHLGDRWSLSIGAPGRRVVHD